MLTLVKHVRHVAVDIGRHQIYRDSFLLDKYKCMKLSPVSQLPFRTFNSHYKPSNPLLKSIHSKSKIVTTTSICQGNSISIIRSIQFRHFQNKVNKTLKTVNALCIALLLQYYILRCIRVSFKMLNYYRRRVFSNPLDPLLTPPLPGPQPCLTTGSASTTLKDRRGAKSASRRLRRERSGSPRSPPVPSVTMAR